MVPIIRGAFTKNNSPKKPMSPTSQKRQVSLEPIIREQFLKGKKLACSTITLLLPVH